MSNTKEEKRILYQNISKIKEMEKKKLNTIVSRVKKYLSLNIYQKDFLKKHKEIILDDYYPLYFKQKPQNVNMVRHWRDFLIQKIEFQFELQKKNLPKFLFDERLERYNKKYLIFLSKISSAIVGESQTPDRELITSLNKKEFEKQRRKPKNFKSRENDKLKPNFVTEFLNQRKMLLNAKKAEEAKKIKEKNFHTIKKDFMRDVFYNEGRMEEFLQMNNEVSLNLRKMIKTKCYNLLKYIIFCFSTI